MAYWPNTDNTDNNDECLNSKVQTESYQNETPTSIILHHNMVVFVCLENY